jgi:hypothetical protein
LSHITSALEDVIEYKIVNIGYVLAGPLTSNAKTIFHKVSKRTFLFDFIKLYYVIRKLNPDILHAFDSKSLFVARSLSIFSNTRIIFTKCGGPNGSAFIPAVDTTIFFSKENWDHAHMFDSYGGKKLLIPNRVKQSTIDHDFCESFLVNYNLRDVPILMRISRFNPYYERTFFQTLALAGVLCKDIPDLAVVIVGSVQSESFYLKFKEHIATLSFRIILVTEEKFTLQASRLLPLAKVVVATGRGVMEACSFGKIVFCPVMNSDFPVKLTRRTFKTLFEFNFSERMIIDYSTALSESLLDEEDTKYFFDKHFDANVCGRLYSIVYDELKKTEFATINYLQHAIRFFK